MKSLLTTVLVLILTVAGPVMAQVDNFGVLDTVYAEASRIDEHNWAVTVSFVNDEKVVGLSIPLKLDAGESNPVVADSAVYLGGRVNHFIFKGFRADTTEQCVTMGLIANMGPTNYTLEPGRGRIATVFVSSLEKKPIENLTVDTTTTRPQNTLMMIADRIQGEDNSDTLGIANRRILEIRPAFVFREQN